MARIDPQSGLLIYTETDHIEIIRRVFRGPEMRKGPFLASQLVHDLLLIGALPAKVDYIDGWWIVSSAKDWLLQPDGSTSLSNFTRIMHFPEAGQNACRSEILLSAFADAVVTQGSLGEATWTNGAECQDTLPVTVLDRVRAHAPGRIVAFRLSNKQASQEG